MKKIILGLLLILLLLLFLKPQFDKKNYGDNEALIKKALCSTFENSSPEMFNIIDTIIDDDYKFAAFSYKNGIGLAEFKKKNTKYEFYAHTWKESNTCNWFTLAYGSQFSGYKFVIIFSEPNEDIKKIKLSVNEKMFEKQVNLNKPSMIDFDINFGELKSELYKFKYEFFDSNDNLIELE